MLISNWKKLIYLIILVLLIAVLSCGCGNEAKIQQLKEEAKIYVAEGKLNDAIEIYNKILEINEDQSLRNELNEIKYEKQSVEKAKQFLDTLYDIEKRVRPGIKVTLTDMQYIVKDLNNAIQEFEQIDTNKNTDIAKYIIKVKKSHGYSRQLKEAAQEEDFQNAGLDEALGNIDSKLGTLNTFLVAANRNLILEGINDIRKIEFPNKYKDLI